MFNVTRLHVKMVKESVIQQCQYFVTSKICTCVTGINSFRVNSKIWRLIVWFCTNSQLHCEGILLKLLDLKDTLWIFKEKWSQNDVSLIKINTVQIPFALNLLFTVKDGILSKNQDYGSDVFLYVTRAKWTNHGTNLVIKSVYKITVMCVYFKKCAHHFHERVLLEW